MLKGAALFGKRYNIGKLITIVRGVHYLPLRSELVTSWTVGFSLDDVYIISLMSAATVLGMIFAVLLLLPDERKTRDSLFQSPKIRYKKRLDVSIH